MSQVTYRDIANALTGARLQMIQLAAAIESDGGPKAALVLRNEQRRLASFVHDMEGRILDAMSSEEGEQP